MSGWKDYLTKGIPVENGAPIPTRKEIRDLGDEELFLFLEGLRRFQTKPAIDDPLSYYQIAGIHGLPYTTWPNLDWNKDIKQVGGLGNDFGGFCTHSDILFLTWHRPFLALYETALHAHVKAVADSISDSAERAKYQTLAQEFRMPYWDWARRDLHGFPQIIVIPHLTNAYKASFKAPIDHPKENPLYNFSFPKGTPDNISVIRFKREEDDPKNPGKKREVIVKRDYDQTQRYPEPVGPSNIQGPAFRFEEWYSDKEKDQTNKISEPERNQIPTEQRNLSERVAYLLQSYQRYGPMCYNYYPGAGTGEYQKVEIWGSLEDIHNSVHVLAGGGGHMGSVPTSAFDPVFWLHHTNIDRLYAIWQALHEDDSKPETFVTEQPTSEKGGSFAKPPQFRENETTPLWPFRKQAEGSGDSVWWTSKDIKRTETFGHAYPETAGFEYPSTPEARRVLQRQIRKYYSSAPAEVSRSMAKNPNAGSFILEQSAVLKKAEEHSASFRTMSVAQMPLITVADTATLVAEAAANSTPHLSRLVGDDKTYLEWLVNVKVQKHALDGLLQVHFFMGPPPRDDDPVVIWSMSPFHVGSFVPLGQKKDTGCAKCVEAQADDLEVTGQIPLTIALFERFYNRNINDLEEHTVEEYLKTNLHWRLAQTGGGIITDRASVGSLKVAVVSNKVTVPENPDDPPIYDPEVRIHPRITTRAGDDDSAGRGDGTGITIAQFNVLGLGN